MRVAILWSHLSGYFNACLHALEEFHNAELFVSYQAESNEAPFDAADFAWLRFPYRFKDTPDGPELLKRLQQFNPDVMLVGSWHVKGYRYVLKHFRGKTLRVMFMDNQWRGTLKQRIGAFVAPLYVQPLYEAVFLPGERQAVFAKKLGFRDSNIIRGGYSCDHPKFALMNERRKNATSLYPRAFIYVGRLTEKKGIRTLSRAYTLYRTMTSEPYDLLCCGEGDLHAELQNLEGVHITGFIQPRDLPAKFLDASCLILPSTFEPWGVVINEATAAGMAIICSSTCGAMVHLVQPGYNGYVVTPGNVDELTRAMLRYSKLTTEQRISMGDHSYLLSLQFTPMQWADNLLSYAEEHYHDHRNTSYVPDSL